MKEKFFTIDSTTILALGRDSIKDTTTAVLELVKNSYDADATEVEVNIYCNSNKPYIRISDNGCGMTENDIESHWLRIGFSKKKSEITTKAKRRATGEKGIGRISADRLGANLLLKTKAQKEEAVSIQVDWDSFERKDKDLIDIPLKFDDKNVMLKIPPSPQKKNPSGTEIIITNLRQKWHRADIEKLYSELSTLTPPIKDVVDFKIIFDTDVTKDFNGVVQSPFYENAELELIAEFDGDETILCTINNKLGKEVITKTKYKWNQLSHKIYDPAEVEIDDELSCGPVKMQFLFYRRQASTIEGTGFSLASLREFLDRNIGVKIYRDNIRVVPYGNPGDSKGDWLALGERKAKEPAAISRPTFKVAPTQLIGAVFIGRDINPTLIDSSSREGLIESKAFFDLRSLALSCVSLMETSLHQMNKKESKGNKRTPEEEISAHINELAGLEKDLKTLKNNAPAKLQAAFERALEKVDVLRQDAKSIEESMSEHSVLRGLATIGIAAAVFGHETQSSIVEFKGATKLAIAQAKIGKIEDAMKELDQAAKYAEQVSAWGSFALSRVQRDKREKKKKNIDDIVQKIINQLLPAMNAASIQLTSKLEEVKSHVFVMDIESVFINLLTNAYHACQQKKGDRKIHVELKEKTIEKKKGFELIVSDTGPGVSEKLREQIWIPLFTTKKDPTGKEVGTGLGLTIVNSVLKESGGKANVDSDVHLGGASFNIWLPIV